jgi:hypothetical protein
MEQERIQKLVSKFNMHQLNAEEQRELEQLIESGKVELDSLAQIGQLEEQISKISFPTPSADLDDRFYHMLALEKKAAHSSFSWTNFFSWPELAPKLAFASVALILGLAIGYFVKPASEGKDIQILSQQVTDLKEMMMLSMLEKESATERLKAVSLTEEMDYASTTVTTALIKTLNQDPNVNVRLAALDALKPYVKDGAVREELIRSIAKQQSPLVQISLAELMAQIQEKSSVKELEKIVRSERTPTDVKKKIKESIKVLS